MEARLCDASFVDEAGCGGASVLADESDGEGEAEEIAVERAGGRAGGGFALHLGEEKAELFILKGPAVVEVGELGELELLCRFEDDGGVDGGDDALRGAVPEEAVARAGGEEDKVAGAGVETPGAAVGVPVHLDGSAGLEVEAEGVMLVLGDFDGAYAVSFEDEAVPDGLGGSRAVG